MRYLAPNKIFKKSQNFEFFQKRGVKGSKNDFFEKVVPKNDFFEKIFPKSKRASKIGY